MKNKSWSQPHVVDQHVDGAVPVLGRLDHGLHLGEVGDVCGHHLDVGGAGPARLLGNALALLGVDLADGDPGPLGGESEADGAPDVRTAARDDDGLSRESQVHGTFVSRATGNRPLGEPSAADALQQSSVL